MKMKKTISFGIVLTLVFTAFVGLVTFPTMANTTESYPLYAGQDELVGHVEVWNDAENLYVKYVIDDTNDWCLTEIHLHVFIDNIDYTDITLNNGNPPPGQFDYIDEDINCEKTYECDPIPLDPSWENIYIAAHAVVWDYSCYDTGVVYGIERYNGNVWGVDVLAGTSWLEFIIPNPPGGNSASPNGLAYNPINGYFYYTDYTLGTNPDTLYFWDGTTQTVAGQVAYGTIPCGDISDGKYYYIPSGTDDLYEITFNPDGTIATDTNLGDISGDTHAWTFNGDIAVKDGIVYGWGLDGSYEYFTYDISTVTFAVYIPTYQSSLQLAFGSNGELYGHRSGGNGAFYEIDITNGDVTLISEPGVLFTDCASGEICIPETETAWGAMDEFGNNAFPGKNWATYFTYEITYEPECKIYLSESFGGTNDGSIIYTVEFDGSYAVLTEEIDLTGQATWDKPHLGVDPDTGDLYLINNGNGCHLGVWDGNSLTDLGGITGLPNPGDDNPGTVLAAFSPEGELYVANVNTDRLYRIDIDSTPPSVEAQWVLTGVNAQGADMAFDEYGVLYLWSNAQGLWEITFDVSGNPVTFNNRGGNHGFTGLAYGACTNNELVGSSNGADGIYDISMTDGSLSNLRTFTLGGTSYDYIYGDMTSGI